MVNNSQMAPQLKSRFMNCKAIGNHAYEPTDVEHVANVITHGISVAPSVLGLQFMLGLASSPLQVVTAIVYGLALIALFTVSTIFHSVFYIGKYRIFPTNEIIKIFYYQQLKKCPAPLRSGCNLFVHSSILHSVIQNSTLNRLTTSVSLYNQRCHRIFAIQNLKKKIELTLKEIDPGRHSSHMWWLVWLFALFGIIYQHIYHERYKWLETVLYTLLGLLPSIAILHMHERSGLTELAVGGCVYIVGIYFFKSDGRIPCAHAIWHLFVSIGASLHFYAVCKYLLGNRNENYVAVLPT